jgi:hypothetical protein
MSTASAGPRASGPFPRDQSRSVATNRTPRPFQNPRRAERSPRRAARRAAVRPESVVRSRGAVACPGGGSGRRPVQLGRRIGRLRRGASGARGGTPPAPAGRVRRTRRAPPRSLDWDEGEPWPACSARRTSLLLITDPCQTGPIEAPRHRGTGFGCPAWVVGPNDAESGAGAASPSKTRSTCGASRRVYWRGG